MGEGRFCCVCVGVNAWMDIFISDEGLAGQSAVMDATLF